MERIGKYEISQLLGEGATSAVYLGFDPFAQREVAIKRLHPELMRGTDRSALYHHLLLNEASLAGKLQHPHIVQIHDAVIEERDAYVVMEYVPGGIHGFTENYVHVAVPADEELINRLRVVKIGEISSAGVAMGALEVLV